MKNKILTFFLSAFVFAGYAQPGSVLKAGKAVFTLTTFKSDGSLLSTSNGIFTDKDGEAISPWTPFIGADSAVVIDTNGKIHEVDVLMGANEIYDLCKFRVIGNVPAAPLSESHLANGEQIWAVAYAHKGKPTTTSLTIKKSEDFMQGLYAFYLFNETAEDSQVGLPVVNKQGEIVALLQQATGRRDAQATDIRYANSLHVENGLTSSEPVYRKTGLRLDLPVKFEDATIMLMMEREHNTPKNYAKLLNDFIQRFPNATEGYAMQAQLLTEQQRFAEADQIMQTALQQVDDKAAIHADYARLMYSKVVYSPDTMFTLWTYDSALEEIQKAYEEKPEPAYQHLQAQIMYSQARFDEALQLFTKLTVSPIRNSELFYEAAQCKQQLLAPKNEVIALLDSAVAVAPQPLTNLSAPYILARGRAYDDDQQYRKALTDYLLYDSLMLGRANDQFYYTRYLCELNLRQYQQALNDIAHAIYINPSVIEYYAELASLQLRVNQQENALKTCELAARIKEDNTDLLIIKGIALAQLKRKNEALEALRQALALGDQRAEGLIEKYK